MTFLNLTLLGGLGAVAVPIIIHFFHRRRVRVVKWGAMHLLDTAIRKHQRRLQLEQLLLLLLRCAIPGALALCLARPVLSHLQTLVGNAKSSVLLLVDNSYSMDYGGPAQSNFQLARQNVARKIDGLGRGSDLAVVLMAGGNEPWLNKPSTDFERFAKALGQLEAGYGKASVPESLEAAAQILPKMQNPFREVILLSDFQRINWTASEAPARLRAVELLKNMPLPPHLTLFHVGAEGRDNVAVESVEFSRLAIGVHQPIQVRANVHNFGEIGHPDLRAFFRVDNKERGATQISLGPREQRQLLFTHTFDTPGSHVVEVYADADSLQADNSAQASILVWDKLPVLLVNGDPSPEPLRGETDFLDIALQPYRKGSVELADLISTRVVDDKGVTAETLARTRVVVLANVKQLSDAHLRALEQFVREGGGLLVLPGNRCNTDWYNRALAANGEGLLPAPLVSLSGSLNESTPPARIVAERFNHPALEMFNDPRNGSLAEGEIKLWFKLGPPADAREPIFTTFARLDSGDPLLVEKKFGEGRVILASTAGDADWGNLPTRPFYLPLMQRLVTYLASSAYPPRNVEVGKPLLAFFPRSEAGKNAVLTDPSGARHELPIAPEGGRGVVEFDNARQPGLYLLNGPAGSLAHFVVSTAREESDLQQLGETELKAAAEELGASLVTSWNEYKDLDQRRRFGREIWPPLLWTVLALVFGELLLEQWFAQRKV